MNLDPMTIGSIIGGIIVSLLIGLGIVKGRNGKATNDGEQQQTPPQPRQPQPSTPQLQGYPMAPPPPGLVDPAGDTGPHLAMTDTQRNLLSPVAQVELMQQVRAQLVALNDAKNGDRYVSRSEFEPVREDVGEIKSAIKQIQELLGTHATHLARISATCAERSKCGTQGS